MAVREWASERWAWAGGSGQFAVAHTALSDAINLEDYDRGVENLPEANREFIINLVNLLHAVWHLLIVHYLIW